MRNKPESGFLYDHDIIALMFENLSFTKSLDEELFDTWLENGRNSKLGYQYLLIIWDMMEETYEPVYFESRGDLIDYQHKSAAQEVLVAAYDLYSESKISLDK